MLTALVFFSFYNWTSGAILMLGVAMSIFISKSHVATGLVKLELMSILLISILFSAPLMALTVFNFIFLVYVLIVIEAAVGLSMFVYLARQNSSEMMIGSL